MPLWATITGAWHTHTNTCNTLINRGLAIALFKQFPRLFDRGWGVICFGCVDAVADQYHQVHNEETLIRVLAPRIAEIEYYLYVPPDATASEKQAVKLSTTASKSATVCTALDDLRGHKDYVKGTPVDILFANSTEAYRSKHARSCFVANTVGKSRTYGTSMPQ
eukprot:scaffold189128_cov21-Tisochrysis_lutea.AAC.1